MGFLLDEGHVSNSTLLRPFWPDRQMLGGALIAALIRALIAAFVIIVLYGFESQRSSIQRSAEKSQPGDRRVRVVGVLQKPQDIQREHPSPDGVTRSNAP